MRSLIYTGFTLLIATVLVALLLTLQTRWATAQTPEIRTLILTNQAQLTAHFGITATQPLLEQLQQLAAHPTVSGTLLLLDELPEVAAAYASWQSNPLSTIQANAVADAIHAVIQAQTKVNPKLTYLVLVGDDRIIPHRRVPDETPQASEESYPNLALSTTVGAALAANMFLSDDFYGDQQITASTSVTIYAPTLAVGRLVETPAEMGMAIAQFMKTNGQIQVTNSLIAGHDFIQDAAQRTCNIFTGRLPQTPDCELISDTWQGNRLDSKLQTGAAELIFLYTDATHWAIGTPDGTTFQADNNSAWPLPASGRLIYSMGGHAGLNVPPETPQAIDWPQAWLAQGAVYVANTGYTWGLYYDIGLSEKLSVLFAEELAAGAPTTVGHALLAAKQRYLATTTQVKAHDRKVVNELTVFGLPMYRITGFIPVQADSFEPDNRCEQAQPISPDREPQLHTLHTATDVDWLSVETITGTTYILDIHVAPSVTLNPAFSLYRQCDLINNQVAAAAATNSMGGSVRISFTALDRGPYLLEVNSGTASKGVYTVSVTSEIVATESNQLFLPLIGR